jgi:hypothetical protein
MRTSAKFLAGARALTVAAAVAAGMLPAAASGQDPEDRERKLVDTAFDQARPAPKQQSKKPAAKPRYKRVTAAKAPAPGPTAAPTTAPSTAAAALGVTIWRLRPSASRDETAARILVHEPSQNASTEWTPERVEADMPLAENQFVRLSIESPREGYLYVIDREQYADGSYSPAYLIFPTTRLRGGDNAVRAGAVVEIPSQADRPVYLTLKRSRPDHVAEVITVLVTPHKLDIKLGENAEVIDAALFASWEKQWGGTAGRLELAGGAGTPYTPAEKAAGANPGQLLEQGDPLPQTVFEVPSGTPVLVNIPLKIAR